MNLCSVFVRNSKHGGSGYNKFYESIKSSISKRKVLFGSTILFGAVAPSLLSDSFSKYALETHSGSIDAKQKFDEKFGSILKWHHDQPLLYAMIGVNLSMWMLWKIQPKFMQKHFLCNLENIQAKRYEISIKFTLNQMIKEIIK